jgi:predicted metal-dependent hydrolase
VAQQTIHYGEDTIQYQIFFVPTRKDKVAIHVHPDGSVQVDAPSETDPKRIKEAVLKRAKWILNHLDQTRRQKEQVLSREYVSGESHFYLGRRYLLKIINQPDYRPQIKLQGGCFRITAPNTNPEAVQAMLWDWYRDHARQYLQRRLEFWVDGLDWLNYPPPWQLRAMRKQWGSCSPNGRLTLNPHLIKAPRRCTDYVLIHELCHLKEHNHSKKFYSLLEHNMPGWRSEKAKLDGMAEMLLAT